MWGVYHRGLLLVDRRGHAAGPTAKQQEPAMRPTFPTPDRTSLVAALLLNENRLRGVLSNEDAFVA